MMKYEEGKREQGRVQMERRPRNCGMRISDCGMGIRRRNHGSTGSTRLSSSQAPQARKLNGQTNPPRPKPKATIETGRALPHVAEGSARPRNCGMRIAELRATSAATLESRTTGHESRFDKLTAGAKAQWPNKAISP